MTTDGLLSVTNWVYLLSLFIAAVASVGLWRLSIASGEEKDRQLERYKTDAGKLIAQADERAGEANKEAGRANERAGQLEKEAAQLRLAFEQEQVKRLQLEKEVGIIKPQVQGLLPPEIEPRKLISLVDYLSNKRGNAVISYDGGDSRTQRLSIQLQESFHSAGWGISGGAMIGISRPSKTGILILGNVDGLSSDQEFAAEAFKQAQIPFEIRLDRKPPPSVPGRSAAPPGWGKDDVQIVVTAPHD